MKATLEFTLPDDQDAYDLSHAAPRWCGAMHDVLEALRAYDNRDDIDNSSRTILDRIRLEVYEILGSWNLSEE